MAKVSFSMPADFLRKVSALGEKTDEIIPRVLEAGGEVAFEKVRDNLESVIGRDTKSPSRSTGELASALGLSPARMDKDGNFNVKVGFSEPRPDGESNAKIANILEYGKHGQPPKPFLKPAKTQARKPGIEAMKEKLEEEIKKI
ncbi:HK97-gp10 family putative phage morphogenesis protein [Caproicibacterium amylolyticum]|uniref:HK97 gp10 family phage protein n=1 Tax=Caproicibacterium amylolyticum TaxID=2766537 RepID=A0A7G9WGP3_9FIRM|nr:HK97-gp10 family putative phage morphogenesis protein [Caproicibacterium amylolyticum]QNO17855.1 HK97 gp10 family phage protein [Caproicibacterium amylolyticum]